MNSSKPDPIHWQPRTWDEAVGSEKIIERYKEMVYGVRVRGLRSGFNTLLLGETRSGKTCLTRFAIRCLYCQDLDLHTLDPCSGTCPTCRENPDTYGLFGFQNHESILDGVEGKTAIGVHYIAVDCTAELNPAVIQKDILNITHRTRFGLKALVIVYFDEVHELARRGLDAMVLKPLEDDTVIWLATSAYADREEIPGRSRTLD